MPLTISMMKLMENLLRTHESPTSKRINAIAVIIPAYNEGNRIKGVLDVLCQIDRLSEIVVVDDGSFDRTMEAVIQVQQCDERIRILHHAKNLGKGQSVYDGLINTTAEVVITLDADLVGLKPEHIYQLIDPVVHHHKDMSIGIFRGGKFYTDFSHWVTPWLSGQRCMWRNKLYGICWKAAEGYGLETAITLAGQRQHWDTKRVIWRGVSHPPSEGHRGLLRGIMNRVKMYAQILRAWWRVTISGSILERYLIGNRS